MQQERDLQADLDWLVGRIRDGYEPEKIILFGSLARGETHEWSDIDLIVVKDTEMSYGERVKSLTALIQDRLIGADILIYSLAEYERARDKGSAFLQEAEMDGMVLYERLG
ncbi:nucleotidyltransferase domain-containing protein [soil metagenome]